MTLGSSDDVAISPLRDYLLSRSSNRRMGQPTALDPETVQSLMRGVEREGAQLRLATDREQVTTGATILAASDRLRFLPAHGSRRDALGDQVARPRLARRGSRRAHARNGPRWVRRAGNY